MVDLEMTFFRATVGYGLVQLPFGTIWLTAMASGWEAVHSAASIFQFEVA